jgi:flagellar biosynthesis/type III secretory pathway M-ring protein FliF/YscJ
MQPAGNTGAYAVVRTGSTYDQQLILGIVVIVLIVVLASIMLFLLYRKCCRPARTPPLESGKDQNQNQNTCNDIPLTPSTAGPSTPIDAIIPASPKELHGEEILDAKVCIFHSSIV